MASKVIVATIVSDQKSDTLGCLRTLTALDYPHYEVVVVDNGSTHGSFQTIRQAYPQVRVVRHKENLGYGEGINGQIRYALQVGADYLFTIKSDVTVEPTTLTALVKTLDPASRIR